MSVIMKERDPNASMDFLRWAAPLHFIVFVGGFLGYRLWLEHGFWQYPREVGFFLIAYALTALGVLGSNVPSGTKRWGYLLLGVVLGCWLKP